MPCLRRNGDTYIELQAEPNGPFIQLAPTVVSLVESRGRRNGNFLPYTDSCHFREMTRAGQLTCAGVDLTCIAWEQAGFRVSKV